MKTLTVQAPAVPGQTVGTRGCGFRNVTTARRPISDGSVSPNPMRLGPPFSYSLQGGEALGWCERPAVTPSNREKILVCIKELWVDGLRGVSGELPLYLAIPDGRPGSGMTILVGSNNSGKSTVVEAFEALSKDQHVLPSFSIGKRNALNPNHLNIHATFVGDENRENWLELLYGGSETKWLKRDVERPDIVVVPSRRGFEPYFGRSGPTDRAWYYNQRQPQRSRPQALQEFEGRLFKINSEGDREKFDAMLDRVMGKTPRWTIDQTESGQYFLKFRLGQPQYYHSSEGIGDGIVSLFVMVSALYDSQPQSVIVIDEPELSLHPHYQRRLRSLLSELSADRQIIYSTHSPYFLSWRDIENGAEVTRAYKNAEYNIKLAQAPRAALEGMLKLESDNTPHTLGINASEVFFLDDEIIITEGQEDVVYFEKISQSIGKRLKGEFYGWGAGGAGNIGTICALLEGLHFKRVVGIFDADVPVVREKCVAQFPNYHFPVLPADDIRDKPERKASVAKKGLWSSKEGLDKSKRADVEAMYEGINTYLTTQG